jgi:Arm DNA-binding domain
MACGSGLTRGMVSFTHRAIEALRPSEAPYRVPDQRCVGLSVRVAPSGIKTWDLAYRIRGSGKVRRVSLGRVADVSLEKARERWPFFTALLVHDLGAGLPSPASALELIEVVLWMSAGLFGTASILWLALLGMERRKLLGLWPFLPLLPLYYLLTSAAAWMALYDLILRPYHWHKTEHGLAKTSRQTMLTLAARTAAARANLL